MENNINKDPIRSKRKLLRLIFIVTIVAIILVINTAYFWYQNAVYIAPNSDGSIIHLTVSPNETLNDLGWDLYENGGLSSIEAYRIYLRLNDVSFNLLAGNYEIPNNLNVPEVLELIAKGPQIATVTATLLEGWRIDEIADELDYEFGLVNSRTFVKEDFMDIASNPDNYTFDISVETFLKLHKPSGKTLEGFIFPDTYNFGVDATAIDVINLAISTLEDKLNSSGIAISSTSRLNNSYEVLILASILEREASRYEDMQIVADIFLRRLEIGMTLGADAPILYKFKDWSYSLTMNDINDTSNPYNLRALPGLTPTPIANPGIAGIRAVLNPVPNDYLYFITGLDGQMYYARTLAEHNWNIEMYL